MNESFTKADIIDLVYGTTGLSKKESGDVVEEVLELMKSALIAGDDVKIAGFGKFTTMEKASRKGRNPQTGEPIEISARRIVTFRPSTILKTEMNS